MKLKILIPAALILVILAISQLIANNDEAVKNGNEPAQPAERKYKTIAIVVHDMRHMFMASVAGMIREKARENENIRILLYDSESSNDKQTAQLNELIGKKVDGIILNPTDKAEVNPAVEKVKKAGIPLITVNMNTTSNAVDCYIGSDSIRVGELQGTYVAEELKGVGNLVVLAGKAGHDATEDRLEGLRNIIGKYPGMHIVRVEYGNWDRSKGAEIMENILQEEARIDAVISQNDEMLLGALQMLERYHLKPVTVGVDGIPEALEAMMEGRIGATVYQNNKAQAAAAFDIMSRLFNNEKVEKVKWIPLELVTPETIDNYIISDRMKP